MLPLGVRAITVLGLALGLVLQEGECRSGNSLTNRTALQPSGLNKFGQSREELTKVAQDLSEALAAVEAEAAAGGHHRRPARSASSPSSAEARLARVLDAVRLPERMTFFGSDGPDARTPRLCTLCHAVAGALIHAFRVGNKTGDALAEVAVDLCVRTNVVAENICRGMSYSNRPFIEYVVRNTPALDGTRVCGTFMPECAAGVASLEWTLDRDLGTKPRGRVRNTMLSLDRPEHVEPYRVLQITDYHWDDGYSTEHSANCGAPTCCRRGSGPPATPEDRAGRWGDYRSCDIPWDTVDEFVKHTKERHPDVDVIYFTGDVVDHGVWETSREKNERRIRDTFDYMKRAFGDLRVLPIVGNHEPHPLNTFSPDYITDDELSSRWLYEILADSWITRTGWLPEAARDTILRGGYYTVLVKEGFRVVALNNMYCYNLNWWLLHDPVDPAGQLAWLVDVLMAAEEAGEKVHILAHIPPGNSDCLEVWGREFARVVDRFSATISAHFNGHTHWDDLCIFYDKHGRPNNVAFNGGSLTTYADVNPNYKVYLVDGNHASATWNVLDAELWGFNLTAANLNPDQRPVWYQMYSFKKTFKVQSLHPAHLEMFIDRLANDRDLVTQYYWYHMLDSDVSHQTGCDDICAESLICNSVTTVTNEFDHCERLLNRRKRLH